MEWNERQYGEWNETSGSMDKRRLIDGRRRLIDGREESNQVQVESRRD